VTAAAYATPDAVLLGEFTPGSPDWHAARANGLGGSEMAAVVDLSPFESHYSLWHRKAGLARPVEQTPAMEWGQRLEDDVVEKLELCHPELLIVSAGTYRNNARPWQIANPDRLAVDRLGQWIGVEAKTAHDGDGWGRQGTDEIPVYYRAQVIHYEDTIGLRRFLVPVLIGNCDYREYIVDYDPVDAALLREAGAAFMASLAAGVVPDLDSHAATYRTVKELALGVIDEAVQIAPSLAGKYDTARAQYDLARDAKREASARVLAAIGNARYAECGTERVAIRTVKADGTTHSLQPTRGGI